MRWPFGSRDKPSTGASEPPPSDGQTGTEPLAVIQMRDWLRGPHGATDDQAHLMGQRCPILLYYVEHFASVDPQQHPLFQAHFVAHVINDKAGALRRLADGRVVRSIPIRGIEAELRALYNSCNNPKLAAARSADPSVEAEGHPEYGVFGPEERGVTGEDAEGELIADAIGVYLLNPNTLKTLAPNVARQIRGAVATAPALNRTIHFN